MPRLRPARACACEVGAVGGHRLFHEDIQALLDRIGEVNPAESRRRGEDGHVARLQAIHRLLVGVEADELAVGRHVDFGADLAFSFRLP